MRYANKHIEKGQSSTENFKFQNRGRFGENTVTKKHGNIDISVSVYSNGDGTLYRFTKYVVRD